MNQDKQKMIFGQIFRVSNQLQTVIDLTLKGDSLTAKQFFLMIVIATFEAPPSLNDIAKRFGSSRQNAKQLVNHLIRNNYVTQTNDPKDKRTLRFLLTDKALDYWKKRDSSDDHRMDKLFDGFTDEMTTSLFQGLSKLMINMNEMENSNENNRHL